MTSNEEHWKDFLSSAQEEVFGYERHPAHPLLSAFQAYLDELAHIKSCEEEDEEYENESDSESDSDEDEEDEEEEEEEEEERLEDGVGYYDPISY